MSHLATTESEISVSKFRDHHLKIVFNERLLIVYFNRSNCANQGGGGAKREREGVGGLIERLQ